MKKILMLGAGVYQVPLIKTAKRLGYEVIAVTIPGNYPGISLVDKVYYLNTTDKEGILEVAKDESVDAVVSTGTDVAVISLGYVAEHMGLPGLSHDAAKKATNKAVMKEAFKAGGVNSAEFKKVFDEAEAKKFAKEIGYPVMVKIVDKSGSRGITKVNNEEELADAINYAKSFSNLPYFLVEKFVKGVEFGIEAFVQKGEIKIIVPHEKLVYQTRRTGVPMGHICPMDMTFALEKKIKNETTKAIHALGLDNCAVNIDAFITDEGEISIIEAAGRCGATGIPEVLSGYLGVDYYEMILKNALGENCDFGSPALRPAASFLLHSDFTGILEDITYTVDGQTISNADYEKAGYVNVHLDDQPGNLIEAFSDGTKRIGQAVFIQDTKEALQKDIRDFEKNFSVRVK